MPAFDDRPLVLTVPGLGNSGEDHWQSHWERCRADCLRVELGDWEAPRREAWVARLDAAIRAVGGPVVLAAHSLGCHAAAWWAGLHGDAAALVVGALLVAPPDLARPGLDGRLADFVNDRPAPLPFPAVLVASSNDPWCALPVARGLAAGWGARLIEAGELGHINAHSQLGRWPEGQSLLDEWLTRGHPSQPTPESLALRAARPGAAILPIA